MTEIEFSSMIRERVLSRINMDHQCPDEEILALIQEETALFCRNRLISIQERETCEKKVFHSIRGLGILQDLIEDQEITEVMVNGTDGIFYEQNGLLHAYSDQFPDQERVMEVIWKIVGEGNRLINQSKPILDSRLSDGSRVNLVLAPVAINGPIISIRKFPKKPLEMEDLIEKRAITGQAAQFLQNAVQRGYNIFVSGGTGSGKTTFLNALSSYINKKERVITIEDSAELQIRHVENLVRLETREANMEGENQISIRDLIRTALRMRPDRIIVGEVRGPEAIDLLQAMNTGHDGCMSTGHANSARDMMSRLETCVLMGIEIPIPAIRSQIASAIDLCVHLERQADGSRTVQGIYEVSIQEGCEIVLTALYEWQREQGSKGQLVEREQMKGLQKWEKYENRTKT